MLTNIEWWGGILIIWSVICYWMGRTETENKLTVDYLAYNTAIMSSILIVAFYFYPLVSQTMKLFYLAMVAISTVTVLLATFWPATEDTATSSKESAEQAGEDDEEELGAFYEILGQAIVLFPLFASLGLGIYKSIELLPATGLIS